MNSSESSSSQEGGVTNEVEVLAQVALELLQEAQDVSLEVKKQVGAILAAEYTERHTLFGRLADYLHEKNYTIIDADTLIKQGYELGKSNTLEELGLSKEDVSLLEWFRKVRA